MLLLFVANALQDNVIGRVYVLVFSARQHYMLSALYAIARPSVTLVYHRKTVEVRIM